MCEVCTRASYGAAQGQSGANGAGQMRQQALAAQALKSLERSCRAFLFASPPFICRKDRKEYFSLLTDLPCSVLQGVRTNALAIRSQHKLQATLPPRIMLTAQKLTVQSPERSICRQWKTSIYSAAKQTSTRLRCRWLLSATVGQWQHAYSSTAAMAAVAVALHHLLSRGQHTAGKPGVVTRGRGRRG